MEGFRSLKPLAETLDFVTVFVSDMAEVEQGNTAAERGIGVALQLALLVYAFS
jgi:hypothetical protein